MISSDKMATFVALSFSQHIMAKDINTQLCEALIKPNCILKCIFLTRKQWKISWSYMGTEFRHICWTQRKTRGWEQCCRALHYADLIRQIFKLPQWEMSSHDTSWVYILLCEAKITIWNVSSCNTILQQQLWSQVYEIYWHRSWSMCAIHNLIETYTIILLGSIVFSVSSRETGWSRVLPL